MRGRRSNWRERSRDLPLSDVLKSLRYALRLVWQTGRYILLFILVIRALMGILPVVTAWLNREVINQLTSIVTDDLQVDFVTVFVPLITLYGIITLGGRILRAIDSFWDGELGRQLELATERIYYEHIRRLNGLRYFETPEFYDMLQMASRSLRSAPRTATWTLLSTVSTLVTLISFAGVLLVFSPTLALMLVLMNIPELVIALRMRQWRYEMELFNSPKGRKKWYLGHLLSSTEPIKESRLFGLADFFMEQFLALAQEVLGLQRSQATREMRFNMLISILYGIFATVAFLVVVWNVYLRQITIGDIALYVGAITSTQGAMGTLINNFASLHEESLFFKEFSRLSDLKDDIQSPPNPQPVPRLSKMIEFRNVSFAYTTASGEVLSRINLTIPAGKKLALVGINGAGKTTMVKLLTRLYDPTEGQILWDGIDIREFEVAELRQNIGVIFQDFMRYSLTARENIGVGDVTQVTHLPHIQEVASAVQIDEMIEKLPAGYETILSRWLSDKDNGADLSGGQWQKMALARLYMRDAQLLILDEPTAALDAQAEMDVFAHFQEITRDKTAILISHRFSTVRMADMIAVIEDGKIAEYGTHEALIALGGTYAELYTAQAQHYQ